MEAKIIESSRTEKNVVSRENEQQCLLLRTERKNKDMPKSKKQSTDHVMASWKKMMMMMKKMKKKMNKKKKKGKASCLRLGAHSIEG